MGKTRKSRRLLRLVIASGLLVVVPSVAAAHEHLSPLNALNGGSQAGSATEAACSMDPRDPRLMKPGAQLCRNAQVTADVSQPQVVFGPPSSLWEAESKAAHPAQVPTGQERALEQHLVPPEGTERIDQAPASSDGTEIEIWWGIVGIVVAAGGVAGLIVALRRGRPHALS